MRASVVVPTFEPDYTPNRKLEEFYTANFDSWRDPAGFDATLILSDFKSSDAFKAFLAGYAQRRGAVFIDGKTWQYNSVAANIGFGLQPYDWAVWCASDCRARDRHWLRYLTEDAGLAAYATTNLDGSHLVDQLQPGPIDKPARRLRFPESAIPNVAAFKREMLEPFGHRMTDISGYDVQEGTVWQLEALGGFATVSYRCNVIHDHFFQGGRYRRQAAGNWLTALRVIEAERFRAIHRFLSTPEGLLDPAPFRPVPFVLNDGLRGFARALYIRARQTQVMYSLNAIRKRGLAGYLFQHRISRKQYERFQGLPQDIRIGLVRTLFFSDPERYRTIAYDVR